MLYDANASIEASILTDRIATANNLLSLNAAVNAVAIYEQNEKQVNDIFLNTLGKGNLDATPAQLASLEAIAAQCPAEGGLAVLTAISLYGALTNSNLPIEECTTGMGGGQINLLQRPEMGQLGLYPNPTDGICTASYQLGKGELGKLTVIDSYRRLVAEYQLDSAAGSIKLNGLPAGIYFVQLIANGRAMQTLKLIQQ
ncbi:MAG: T9SS type A sorting domain-containing protein [Saprospiraceae bacterium]|nr:T9SS type A sorting domain-containing protein [Saprospiraceae bacterium]